MATTDQTYQQTANGAHAETQEKDYGNGKCSKHNPSCGIDTRSIRDENCSLEWFRLTYLGYSNDSNHLHSNMGHEDALRRIRTAGSISISPELFEKIYLSPQNQVKGELRKTFGNPTPL
jgi:hypothetical protein